MGKAAFFELSCDNASSVGVFVAAFVGRVKAVHVVDKLVCDCSVNDVFWDAGVLEELVDDDFCGFVFAHFDVAKLVFPFPFEHDVHFVFLL